MTFVLNIAFRLCLLLGALVLVGLDTSDAYAQSMNCRALANSLSQLDRNGSFDNLGGLNSRLRQAQADVQRVESQYVRDGCNAAAKRGDKLSPQCQVEARAVIKARNARDALQQQTGTGDAVAQQREAILQDMARFNCNGQQTQQPPRRGNLFDQLFGAFEDSSSNSDGVDTRGDNFSGFAGYETVRTVCVRKSDGYYWPISYSTLKDYAPNDLTTCQEQCPGVDVDLYYYDNPGQEPSQMINLQGQAYTSLPTAFAYRTSYDPANACKKSVTYGSVALVAQADGSNRAMITYGEDSFPLPMRDPRRAMDVTVMPVAANNYVDIPLPRPRPAAPGEAPNPVVVQQASAKGTDRVVMFGDKRVRVVGPDTPYAPTEAAGT